MGQSYRIRTEIGITKSINVELEQEFEFLEILSLKLNQTDIYLRACSDYGVIVGRVTANNGLGLPNARVSVFIPIDFIDQSNPIISSIYPYLSPEDKNEDGYRYNILPYEKSYSVHAATGTLPTRLDVLTGNTAYEIYDKYYKFTAKTNESGDYMIMGVPVGQQSLVMDVDLSDIGEFSLTPQDLIRMGRATEAQVAGSRFKTSNDLNSLPQIVNITKNVEVSPLWGEPSICQIAINRVDFDLRDEANIDIQPTSVFIGSIYSTPDNFRIRPPFRILGLPLGESPRDNFGNLCSLTTGPGQILCLRQTINLDSSGNPILEEYRLEQNGNVIDENGAWYVELPMNLDYFITNEFGERIISYDPTIGIPTKAKYRFKVKWQQPDTFSASVRRPYFLVPNIREFGWTSTGSIDPNTSNTASQNNKEKLKSSYYFGLDWSGYTYGFSSQEASAKINDIIDCKDTFYEFQYNKVYTIAGLIDQYKSGARARFIGIKEIDSNDCDDTVNKFPVNEGFRNFDFLFFVVSLLLQVIQVISAPLLIIIHFVAFLLDVAKGLRNLLTALFGFLAGVEIYRGITAASRSVALTGLATAYTGIVAALIGPAGTLAGVLIAAAFPPYVQAILVPVAGPALANVVATQTIAGSLAAEATIAAGEAAFASFKHFASAAKYLLSMILTRILFARYNGQKIQAISLPTLTYPDCDGCSCKSTNVNSQLSTSESLSSLLTRFSDPFRYFSSLSKPGILPQSFYDENNVDIGAFAFAQAIGGTLEDPANRNFYKTTESPEYKITKDNQKAYVDFFAYSNYLPFGERVNLFNTRKKYFDGVNKIKVTFDTKINTSFHYDNTLTLFFESKVESGTLLTFVNPNQSTDVNYIFSGNSGEGSGISGQTLQTGPSAYDVEFCDPNNQYVNRSTRYQISQGCEYSAYTFPADIEYYQVITAITVSDAISLFQGSPTESLPELVNSGSVVRWNSRNYSLFLGATIQGAWGDTEVTQEYPMEKVFDDYKQQYITILQRGVDPYSPKVLNKYGLGHLFGNSSNPDAITVTASTRLNIPIQKLNSTSMSVQPFTVNGQSEIFYPSHFFRGGIPNTTVLGLQWSAFTTPNVGYYSSLDSNSNILGTLNSSAIQNGVVSLSSNYAYGTPVYAKYNSAEDISGTAFMYVDQDGQGKKPSDVKITYTTNVLLPFFETNPMNINTNALNIMRTDRLPSSDVLDGLRWNFNPSILQQNLGFAVYEITADGPSELGIVGYGTGADIVTENIEGQYSSVNVLNTLNVCSEIVSLQCYSGNGTGFTINRNCVETDAVVKGCYQFVKKPLTDIRKDIRNFNEWAYRFRFFYALCRGVLSQTFTNNWINGSLFTFPVQIDTTFNSQNKPNPPNFPKKIVYFDSDTNNFYYRSSPYVSGNTPTEFVGAPANPNFPQFSVNSRNLLFPTTIINLGMKDFFYREIILDPSTNSYIMNNLDSTSYSDNSDIVNLFVLSRITNASFLQQMLNLRDYSVNSLFTRYGSNFLLSQTKGRVDADLVQMLSINNEVGVIPFSPEYYPFYSTNPNNSVVVLSQGNDNSTIGIFFSSTTEDLQTKDFISPGIIDFRFNPNVTAVTYKYGIKSQVVPFYQWQLTNAPTQISIFGSEKSNWATTINDIVQSEYQNLNRRNTTTPNYFVPAITGLDVNQRGYIYNIGATGYYDWATYAGMKTKFMIGAPNQFYFGVVKGASALDKFKEKYLPNE